jgi:hypothetical protein
MKYYDRMKILSSINKSMKDNDLENDEELDIQELIAKKRISFFIHYTSPN